MIPPPYPFPRKWQSLFQQQQPTSGHAAQWLTPYTQILQRDTAAPSAATETPAPLAFPHPAPLVPVHAYQESHAPAYWNPHMQTTEEDAHEEDGQEESDDDDYEYGYVLNDDWRQYLKDNVLSEDESWEDPSQTPERQPQRQHGRHKKPESSQGKRPRGGKKHQPKATPRPPSQLELALDAARELERQRRQQRLVTTTEDTSSREEASAASHMTISSGSKRVPGDPSGEDERHSSLQVVEHLEAALHLRFEAFCDNKTPAVWPQGAS